MIDWENLSNTCQQCNSVKTCKKASDTQKCPAKLFRIWASDGNDRDEKARVKAFSITDVLNWIKQKWFKPEALESLEIDESNENSVYITWVEGCEDCTLTQEEKDSECDMCENIISYSLEIEEIEEPELSDFEYKTIQGTNEFYDLTGTQPEKAKDWDPELSKAWQADPQRGANLLLTKTLIAQAQGKSLGE